MATFGASAYTNAVNALASLVNKSIACGYSPATAIAPADIPTAVLASFLDDDIPATSGITVGAGNKVKKLYTLAVTITPAVVTAQTGAEQTFTFTGVTTDDLLLSLTKPTAQAGLTFHARLGTADRCFINYVNATTANITPTAEAYKAVIARF